MIALIATFLTTKTALGPKAAAWIVRGVALALAALALWLAYSWAWDRGKDHERAKWEAAAEILEDADDIADAEAMDVATETKGTIDAGNERAEDAARGSDDPLRDAFGSLRKEGSGGSDKATR